MKKIILTILVIGLGGLAPLSAYAKDKDFVDYLKSYGIPCGVSLAAGLLLADESKDGMAMGAVGCAAAGTVTYLHELEEKDREPLSDEDRKKVEEMVQSSIRDEMTKTRDAYKTAIEKTLEEALKQKYNKMEEALKAENEETQNLMREVLAAQLVEMKESMKKELFQKIQNGEFMPKLEANIRKEAAKASKAEFKAQKEGIIKKAVEGTLKEVITQSVGLPEDPEGLDQ